MVSIYPNAASAASNEHETGAIADDLMRAALAYAKQGIPVFPCRGKRPMTTHGLKDATTDPEQIAEWWTKWPNANIGACTGKASGFWALDVDGDAGRASMGVLVARHGQLPKTCAQKTGSGGYHFYFAANGQEVRNSASQLEPGLDIRGDGGYVIFPTSIHPDTGLPYVWVNS